METIDNVIAKYNDFKSNENKIWINRFTYKREMKYAMVDIDLMHFENETHAFEKIVNDNTIGGFLKNVEWLSNDYINWAKTKIADADEELLTDMKNWFKGTLGEYFYYCALDDIKCFYITPDATNNVMRFDFNYITPIAESDDHGVDFIGTANDVPCVLQMKTYHDFEKVAPMSWYIKAYGEGCANDYINQHDKHNTFLCWFGTESNGLMSIRENKGFNDKALCLGYSTLKDTIDKKNAHFWKRFYDNLCYIK